MLHKLLEWLPPALRSVLERLPPQIADRLEEIRIREGRPLEIGYAGLSVFVRPDGACSENYRDAYVPEREQCRTLLERITRHSLYAAEEELRRGYVTIPGGHRIGLAGQVVLEDGRVKRLRDVAAFNVRVARAQQGCSSQVLPSLLDVAGRTIRHTLIVSPPQQGKTTLLRDLVRAIGAGDWRHPSAAGWRGRKVGVVDERSEIAACERGVPTFDVGPRCDVLDACPKAEGIMMLIRSMSPEVIAVDEIGRAEDARAIREALHAGVRVIATAHASDLADVFARPVLAQLAREGVFGAYVLLSREGGRTAHRVFTREQALAAAARQPDGRPFAARDAPRASRTRSPSGGGSGP